MSRALPATCATNRGMIVSEITKSEPAEDRFPPAACFSDPSVRSLSVFMTHYFSLFSSCAFLSPIAYRLFFPSTIHHPLSPSTDFSSILKTRPHVPGPMCAPDVSDEGLENDLRARIQLLRLFSEFGNLFDVVRILQRMMARNHPDRTAASLSSAILI